MADSESISIQVAFGTSEKQLVKSFRVPAATTVIEAVRLAELGADFPEADWENAKKGIYGRVVDDSQVLAEGDRVEVYRPLVLTPQDARKRRASKGAI